MVDNSKKLFMEIYPFNKQREIAFDSPSYKLQYLVLVKFDCTSTLSEKLIWYGQQTFSKEVIQLASFIYVSGKVTDR